MREELKPLRLAVAASFAGEEVPDEALLARIDEDGDIYIIGRTKNVIILENGENVPPEELEDILNNLPFVQASLVYEGKNAIGKSVIAAEIFPAAKALEAMKITDPRPVIQDAIDKINAKMPSYMHIAQFTIRDTDFPRSGSMKVIRDK